MGSMSWVHWVVVVAVVVILFGGRGRISGLMGEVARGVRAFKDGLKGESKLRGEQGSAVELDPPTGSEGGLSHTVRDSASGSRQPGDQAH